MLFPLYGRYQKILPKNGCTDNKHERDYNIIIDFCKDLPFKHENNKKIKKYFEDFFEQ